MTFWMMFALLLVVASGFLSLPFISHRRRVIKNASAESIERANVSIFRDQQAQLQHQLDNSDAEGNALSSSDQQRLAQLLADGEEPQ